MLVQGEYANSKSVFMRSAWKTWIPDECTLKQGQHEQAFFERAGLTEPKAKFRDTGHHDEVYELVKVDN